MMMMNIPKINNYYIRDDGLVILIQYMDSTTFGFKVILPTELYRTGDHEFDFTSNIYDYKSIDYKVGKRFDKLITS